MTDTGQDNVPDPNVNREDETTHIAQRESTREIPVQQGPQSTWSGGSTPVGSGDGASAQAGPQGGSAQPAPGGNYSNAPSGEYQGASPQGSQGSWSSPQQPYPSQSPSGQQGYGSAPQGSWNQQQGYPSSQQGYGSAAPQSYPSAPQGSQQGYGSAAPQGSWNSQQPTYGQPTYGSSAPQGSWNGPNQQQGYGSAPQGSWNQQQGYPSAQPGYGSATQSSWNPQQQQPSYGSAPQGSWSGSQQQRYGSQQPSGQQNPFVTSQPNGQFATQPGYPSAQAKPSGPKPQLAPLEKFGPLLPAFVAFLAAFLTWASFKSGGQTVSLNGIGGNSNSANPDLGGAKSTGGWLTIVLALALAGVAIAATMGKLKASVIALTTAGISLIVFIVALVQFANVNSVVNSDAGKGYSGTIGIGVWLTMFAGLVGLALGIYGFISARKGKSSSGTSGAAGPSVPSSNGQWSQYGQNGTAQGPQSSWGQGR